MNTCFKQCHFSSRQKRKTLDLALHGIPIFFSNYIHLRSLKMGSVPKIQVYRPAGRFWIWLLSQFDCLDHQHVSWTTAQMACKNLGFCGRQGWGRAKLTQCSCCLMQFPDSQLINFCLAIPGLLPIETLNFYKVTWTKWSIFSQCFPLH